MKKMIICVLCVMMLIVWALPAAAAHPATIASGTTSTASNLITVKKPDTASTATMKTTYSITGVGQEGVSVCFYMYDGEHYTALRNSDLTISSLKIGASGVFYRQVALKDGINRICVRAEADDGSYQVEYFSINVIKNDVLSGVGSFSLNMQSRYNGWLN